MLPGQPPEEQPLAGAPGLPVEGPVDHERRRDPVRRTPQDHRGVEFAADDAQGVLGEGEQQQLEVCAHREGGREAGKRGGKSGAFPAPSAVTLGKKCPPDLTQPVPEHTPQATGRHTS